MIVGAQKPLDEIKKLVEDAGKVLVVGCGTCVTVSFAGGTKEVGILASSLRMACKIDGNSKQFDEATVQRQCEWEYIDPLAARLEEYDLVLSLGCGIGVQALAERFPKKTIMPGLNTTFLGMPTEHGVFEERCQACGDCILGITGGICPIARCSKQLLNGPCGGSQRGKCEVSSETSCAWQLIYDRMAARGELDRLLQIQPIKNWSTSRDGGPRRIIREDLRTLEDKD
jgi:ferredoxin